LSARRVVSGKNESGRSYFVHDGPTPGHVDLGVAVNEEIWIDGPANPDPGALIDPVNVDKLHLLPPVGGSVVCVHLPVRQLPVRNGSLAI
jgi:hypothetical protein